MSQDNFDDLLKQSFEKERDIPFDEEAWQSLSGRLNSTRGFLLPLWAILLLGLGWLAAAGLGFAMASHHAGAATPAEPAFHNTANSTLAKPGPCDTVYQHQDTLIIKDTVFLMPQNLPAVQARNTNTVADLYTKSTAPLTVQQIKPKALPAIIDDNDIPGPTITDGISPIPAKPVASQLMSHSTQVDWLYQKTTTRIPEQPGRFQIGISSGWGNILKEEDNIFAALTGFNNQDETALVTETEFDTAFLQQHLAPSGILQHGISLSYRLNAYFNVQAEFGRERISYEFNNNPLSNSLDPLYEEGRSNAETNRLLSQRSLFYEIGFQSQLPKRLSPILLTGLRMRSHLSSVALTPLEGEAEGNSGAYVITPQGATNRSPSKGLRIEQVRLGTGLQYQINNDWAVHSSIDTYLDIREDSWARPDWALNVGLKYRLPAKKTKP
jgi:hypothetical protein